tara:strand:+ start:2912 stop:3184 length:273 start_codon:yes stop_codon:yes gene_type:complete
MQKIKRKMQAMRRAKAREIELPCPFGILSWHDSVKAVVSACKSIGAAMAYKPKDRLALNSITVPGKQHSAEEVVKSMVERVNCEYSEGLK